MLLYALTLLGLALLAAVLGASGVTGIAADFAWVSVVGFLVVTVAAAVVHAVRGPPAIGNRITRRDT